MKIVAYKILFVKSIRGKSCMMKTKRNSNVIFHPKTEKYDTLQ